MSRDPKTEPRFGDVFRMSGDSIMYLSRDTSSAGADWWWGVDLSMTYDPPVQTWVRLSVPEWEFVESLASDTIFFGHGAAESVLTSRGKATIAKMVAALEAKGFTNVKPIGPSAIQYDEP